MTKAIDIKSIDEKIHQILGLSELIDTRLKPLKPRELEYSESPRRRQFEVSRRLYDSLTRARGLIVQDLNHFTSLIRHLDGHQDRLIILHKKFAGKKEEPA